MAFPVVCLMYNTALHSQSVFLSPFATNRSWLHAGWFCLQTSTHANEQLTLDSCCQSCNMTTICGAVQEPCTSVTKPNPELACQVCSCLAHPMLHLALQVEGLANLIEGFFP